MHQQRNRHNIMIFHVVKTQPIGTKYAIGQRQTTKYMAERYNEKCKSLGWNTEVVRFKNVQEMSDWIKAHNAALQ